jgi:uncharacterized protein YcbX
MSIKLEYIYRYPVKGFRAERLERGELRTGAGLAWDRAFAFTSGNQPPPKDNTSWTPARSFIQMTVYPQLARFTAAIDEAARQLHITSPEDAAAMTALQAGDDTAVNELMNKHFTPGPASGISLHRMQDAHGHWDFTDTGISIINLATVEWLEWVSGLTLSHLRFRGNLYITGLEAFDEFALAGQTVRIGTSVLKILRPAMRCAATTADPWSGDTSIDVVNMLRTYAGHMFCGMYAQVLKGGEIFEDDRVRPVHEAEAFNPAKILPDRTPDPVLWPRSAIATRTDNGTIDLRPMDHSWPFLPANAGARVWLHPGLDFTREPQRMALIERGKHDLIQVASDGLDDVPDGSKVVISGPVERTSGRA